MLTSFKDNDTIAVHQDPNRVNKRTFPPSTEGMDPADLTRISIKEMEVPENDDQSAKLKVLMIHRHDIEIAADKSFTAHTETFVLSSSDVYKLGGPVVCVNYTGRFDRMGNAVRAGSPVHFAVCNPEICPCGDMSHRTEVNSFNDMREAGYTVGVRKTTYDKVIDVTKGNLFVHRKDCDRGATKSYFNHVYRGLDFKLPEGVETEEATVYFKLRPGKALDEKVSMCKEGTCTRCDALA
jgi:hypothetical protein